METHNTVSNGATCDPWELDISCSSNTVWTISKQHQCVLRAAESFWPVWLFVRPGVLAAFVCGICTGARCLHKPDRWRSPEKWKLVVHAGCRMRRYENGRLEMTNVPIDSMGETTCESVSVSACERETAKCVRVCVWLSTHVIKTLIKDTPTPPPAAFHPQTQGRDAIPFPPRPIRKCIHCYSNHGAHGYCHGNCICLRHLEGEKKKRRLYRHMFGKDLLLDVQDTAQRGSDLAGPHTWPLSDTYLYQCELCEAVFEHYNSATVVTEHTPFLVLSLKGSPFVPFLDYCVWWAAHRLQKPHRSEQPHQSGKNPAVTLFSEMIDPGQTHRKPVLFKLWENPSLIFMQGI